MLPRRVGPAAEEAWLRCEHRHVGSMLALLLVDGAERWSERSACWTRDAVLAGATLATYDRSSYAVTIYTESRTIAASLVREAVRFDHLCEARAALVVACIADVDTAIINEIRDDARK